MPSFSARSATTPTPRPNYQFDTKTTLSVLAGLVYNKRTLVLGSHGVGKSTHIEQVCSKLNWGCVRLSMDGHMSRLELIGRDAISVRGSTPVVKFKYGLVP